MIEGSGPALSVEMTAYALLSLVKLGSKKDMTDARSIVRWLSKQRNSEGGFVSTQDTVVGLQVNKRNMSTI
jgi:prenyltransferase beta subunit